MISFIVGSASVIFLIQPFLDEKKLKKVAFIYTIINYGKLNEHKIKNVYQVSKSSFKHFYTLAFIYSTFTWFLAMRSYMFKTDAPEVFKKFLDLIASNENREVIFNRSETLLVTTLLYLQISRRFYESNFVQIFSGKAKMDILTVILAALFYVFFISANVLNSIGFNTGTHILLYHIFY